MTVESHKRASELLPLIEEAKTNLDKWEKAKSFASTANCNFTQSTGYSYVSLKHLPFDIIRIISIDGFKKELAALEREFNSL